MSAQSCYGATAAAAPPHPSFATTFARKLSLFLLLCLFPGGDMRVQLGAVRHGWHERALVLKERNQEVVIAALQR